MQPYIRNIDFRDGARAHECLAHITSDLPEDVCDRLGSLLAASADPDTALNFLERLHRERRDAFDRLAESSTGLQLLIAVFSYSCFLSEAILAYPEWLEALTGTGMLERLLHVEDLAGSLERMAAEEGPGVPSPHTLALFRRRQILRVLLRDVTGMALLPEVTEELSNIADATLDVCYRRIRDELAERHGLPSDPRFTILSLGKLGGAELNYSSDIDLMFLIRRQRRDRRAGPHQQQGIPQEARQPAYRAVVHLYRRGSRLPRGPAAAARWAFRRGGDLARRRQNLLPKSRPRLGIADAHQGARFSGRSRAGYGAIG